MQVGWDNEMQMYNLLWQMRLQQQRLLSKEGEIIAISYMLESEYWVAAVTMHLHTLCRRKTTRLCIFMTSQILGCKRLCSSQKLLV